MSGILVVQDNYSHWLWMHKADDGVVDHTSEPFTERAACIHDAGVAYPRDEVYADGLTEGAQEVRPPLPQVEPDPALMPH